MGRLVDMLDRSPTQGRGRNSLLRFLGEEKEEGNDFSSRIGNAQERLLSSGIIPPEPEKETPVLERVFNGLNFFNNQKNKLLLKAGGADQIPDKASGSDVLVNMGLMDEGAQSKVAGFLFDLVTDPLNLLTFGAGGAAAKTGVKLLGSGAKTGAATGKTVAKLGAGIPFTKLGFSVDVPGSDKLISGLSGLAGKGRKKLTDYLDTKPNLSKFVDASSNLIGKQFNRNYGLPEGVGEITQRTQDLIRIHGQDVVNQMVAMRRNWEEIGHTFDDDAEIIKAVEDARHFSKLTPAQVKVFNDVKDFFDVNYLKAQEAGVIDEFRQNYIPHIFKGKKEEVMRAMEQLRRRGAKLRTSTPFGQERTLMVELAEILADPELVKVLKPETNLSKLMGIYKMSLEKAIANQDMVDELLALDGVSIPSSIHVQDPVTKTMKKVSVPAPHPGWVEGPVAQLKGFWVDPDVSGHLKDILEPFNNNVQFEKMMKLYDGVLGWWKFMATVPNVGFHVRNSIGNMWNNYLGGVRDLKNYKTAFDIQRAEDFPLDEFYNLIRSVKPWDQPRLTAQGLGGSIPGTGIDPRDVFMERIFDDERFRLVMTAGKNSKVNIPVLHNGKVVRLNSTGMKFLAKMYGVTGKGMFSGDIGEDIMAKLSVTDKGRFNPGSRNFAPLSGLGKSPVLQNVGYRGAEKAGGVIEDNARIAHFITKIMEGMTPEEAAASVKKYLFDYTELSANEKNVFKRWMPFYAFTRFNLPLQLKELIKQPKYATVMGKFQNFMNELSEEENGTESDERSLPKYLRNLYSFRLPFQIGAEGRDVYAGVDLPIRDLNSLSPREWVTMITPIISAPAEQVFNRNLYFDRDIERFEGETVRAPGYLQGIFRMIQASDGDLPYDEGFRNLVSKFGLTVALNNEGAPELRVPARAAHGLNQLVALKNFGKGVDFITGDTQDPFASASMLTGITGVSNTEGDRKLNLQYQQLNELEDLLAKFRNEGDPVATLRELEEGGDGLAGLLSRGR